MSSNEKTVDDLMHFLKNMEVIDDQENIVYEYEVITDASFVGEFDNGIYQLIIWELSNKVAGEEKRLCLRITQGDVYKDYSLADDSGYYHGGGVEEELIFIASLAFRKRLNLGPITRRKDKPFYVPRIKPDIFRGGWIDPYLVKETSNLSDLSKYLELVKGLKIEYHQRFIWALKLYNRAISITEKEPDMAYLHLISAIEALCQDAKIDKVNLSEFNSKLDRLINEVEDIGLRNKIKNEIIKNERFIRRRFVQFILNNVEKDFWDRNITSKTAVLIKPENLQKLLKNIYDQRSVTLHNGTPFPPYIFDSAQPPDSDILGALDISHLGRKWHNKDFIPYLHFFEGLVNYVLKTFLKKNQKNGEYSVINFPVHLTDDIKKATYLFYF